MVYYGLNCVVVLALRSIVRHHHPIFHVLSCHLRSLLSHLFVLLYPLLVWLIVYHGMALNGLSALQGVYMVNSHFESCRLLCRRLQPL